VRCRAQTVGRTCASRIRRRAPQFGDTWHRGAVVIPINGNTQCHVRAADADGLWRPGSRRPEDREGWRTAERLAAEKLAVEELAVEKLLRKLIRTQSRTPRVMVTDKPGSDGAARTGMGLNVEHRQHMGLNHMGLNHMGLNHMGLNNRAEKPGKNAHLPTQRHKRIIKRSTSARHLQCLVVIHDQVANLHSCPRHARSSSGDRALRAGRWSRGARSPNRASPRSARGQHQGKAPGKSARGKRPVFTWPPFGTLRVPVWVSLLSAYAALEYSGLCI
jgi:putative transposase